MDQADMTTYFPHSRSSRKGNTPSPQSFAPDPITPIHSPHHSVHSSTSLRSSVHALSLHEYRKQQNTPDSRAETPAGRTLRRKAAAPALNKIERAPPVTHPRLPGPPTSSRTLQVSQSVQQLPSHSASQPSLLDHAFRSQSAEPRVQSDKTPSEFTTNLSFKARTFGSRKRLPKPVDAKGDSNLYPPPLAIVCTTQSRRSPLSTAVSASREDSQLSHALTTPTPSSFSLSRFPQPPYLTDPSFSPPPEEKDIARLNALSFASTAPATPPATPAVIHYRGTSFDLVNPHESLLFHDIVTPLRDFDSSEFLHTQSCEQPFELSPEMAPRRALYRDLNSAHASIMRRADDSFSGSNLDLPLPPVPAAVSPCSSTYSPLYSPDSNFAPPPLAVKKHPNESRFSLKQLKRSLTRKLVGNPEKQYGEELQDFNPSIGAASMSVDEKFSRSHGDIYVTTPGASYFPINPASPVSPISPESPRDLDVISDEDNEIDFSGRYSTQRYDSEPLMSMVPDDHSTQMGRNEEQRASMSEGDLHSKPYYETSIYASSSVYTTDDRRRSRYQQSLSSTHQNNLHTQYNGIDANRLANEYSQDSLYSYNNYQSTSCRMSKPLAQEMPHCSIQADSKTDTISKFIDRYDPGNVTSNSLPIHEETTGYPEISRPGTFEEIPSYQPQSSRLISGVSQFEFGLGQTTQDFHSDDTMSHTPLTLERRVAATQGPGLPPQAPAPLAPAFQHDRTFYAPPRPELSDMFSNGSFNSYGDTRNLLQTPQSEGSAPQALGQGLQPSSSYSQVEMKRFEPSSSYSQADGNASPQTPQAALDQAEQIFQTLVNEHQQKEQAIPLIWARRSSGNLMLAGKCTEELSEHKLESQSLATFEDGAAEQRADWETIAENSQRGRESLDSIADYSSSEGSQNGLGLNSDGSLPSWAKQTHSHGLSHYSHPSPLRAEHAHPFSSSPPSLMGRIGVGTTPKTPNSPKISNPPSSSTLPSFRNPARCEDILGKGAVNGPYAFTPWADPYAFSDKETQELLASGPNDDIIVQDRLGTPRRSPRFVRSSLRGTNPIFSSPDNRYVNNIHARENSLGEFSVVGPAGNRTGSPQGNGMHEAGSSIADTSSPGGKLSSSIGRSSIRSDYQGFYASPFPATGSITRIQTSQPTPGKDDERIPSQTTIFSNVDNSKPIQEAPPLAGRGHRQPLRCSTTFQRTRRTSRAAVPGQTKLRHMFLAPDSRATISSQGSKFSRFMPTGGSERPSTSDTNTPLRPNFSIETLPTIRSTVAHNYSPHLLCPERKIDAEDEVRRRKLSWFIFAAFCLLPPCIILHRFYGNSIILWLTKGHLDHCIPQSHRVALIAGITVNVVLVTGILVPILVAHALKAL